MSTAPVPKRKKVLGPLFIGVLLAVAIPACLADENNLIRDLREVIKENPRGKPVTTDILRNHIPIGTNKEDGLEILKKSGFKIFEVKDKRDFDSEIYDEAYIAHFTLGRSLPNLWFANVVKVIVHIKNGKIENITGKIYMDTL